MGQVSHSALGLRDSGYVGRQSKSSMDYKTVGLNCSVMLLPCMQGHMYFKGTEDSAPYLRTPVNKILGIFQDMTM